MHKIILILFLTSFNAHAKLKVITTTTNLASLVEQIGGDYLDVESLCRGIQDPHFLEAKPSYIFKLSKADLLVSVGAGLEVGWLPLIIRGSRNPNMREGESGHLVAAEHVSLVEVTEEAVSRSDGDIHPEGNPHFMLSPSKALEVASALLTRLIVLDKNNSENYKKNFMVFKDKLTVELKKWKKLISPQLKVISYHKTLSYFYNEFKVQSIDVLEPKPGIPPSAAHVIKLIRKMKAEGIKKIIIENYFDDTVGKRIQKEIPDVKIIIVPVAVNGNKDAKSLLGLYNELAVKIGL